MPDRFFLDTNVFVYSFDRTEVAKSQRALQLLRTALRSQKGITSYQVVQEFFNLSLQSFPKPMKVDEAEHYLDTVFRPMLSVHSSVTLYLEAMHLQGRYRISWYDSLIVAAATQAQCELLMTEALQHGSASEIFASKIPFCQLPANASRYPALNASELPTRRGSSVTCVPD